MRKYKRFRAVVFDLDDTLYNQRQHLAGAFLSVGKLISRLFGLDPRGVRKELLEIAKRKGSASGKLFNIFLEKHGIKPKKRLLEQMVSAFYSYKPVKLKPYKRVVEILKELRRKGLKPGILTDGNPQLQKAKIEALGIKKFLNCVLVTDEMGENYRKPDLKGFLEISKQLGVSAAETIYVGDNPHKDFIGARKAGMLTIRVLTGEYRKVRGEKSLEADIIIRSLGDLRKILCC